jgi:UDPglucose 6-dehydrogenase
MPGETDRLQLKYPHLNIAYNPVFVALGSVEHDFTNPDIILIGCNDEFLKAEIKLIYSKVCLKIQNFCEMSPLEAEVAKLTLNCYVTAKITFANQIGNLCHRLKISPSLILDAVGKDSRVGKKYFKAGLGYGGPCFPRDNLAMSAFMIEKNLEPLLTRTIHQLNKKQVDEIVLRIDEREPKVVGFTGLSYKEGTDVEDESQLKAIWEILRKRGYEVKIGKGDVNLSWDGLV